MEAGADVWLRDDSRGWVSAVVQSKRARDDGKVQVEVLEVGKTEPSEAISFVLENDMDEINDIKLKNSEAEGKVENLITLPYLHEPAILYCLEQRYLQSDIYTFTGPILIAVNPFKKVDIYSNSILEQYYNHGLLKSQNIGTSVILPPHVFAIADAAYREMMKVILANLGSNSTVPANQAILISGESGAGKTESTKVVLKYLTSVGNASGSLEMASGSVMDKILQSNPILEAFGNARTLRNDNSSRFGKYIDLNFNRRGHLIGGTIRTYLLEKVRLPTQQVGERNFHIFYQMFKGGSAEELNEWHLTTLPEFFYTNQGEIYDLRHINDAEEFKHMKNALQVLNFDPADQKNLLKVLAGLLHIGQLQFVPDASGEGCELKKDGDSQAHAEYAAELCGLEVGVLIRTLTVRIISTRGESYEKKMTPAQAADARDAFAKAIYGKIFDWIVVMINKSIQVEAKQIRADIGVLDIFGFECFKHNSFEQLCINYTNEALQQQFNQYVFKMEQQEYQNEAINWSFIEFPDNQDCLQLIDHKQNGILAMIDDECKLPGASDQKLAARMYKSLESFGRFSATAPMKRDFKFCIKHYAGPVVYSVNTFVDKNKDELPKEAASLLFQSGIPLLSRLFTPAETQPTTPSSKSTVPSVGSQFKEQLNRLMEKIYSTTPHYIRCLKPNDENLPSHFNRIRTTEQLRYGGVLEAVRVARSGFPVRLSHCDFYGRYRSLANPFHALTSTLPTALAAGSPNNRSYCEQLLEALLDEYVPNLDEVSSEEPKKKRVGRRQSRVKEMTEWAGKLASIKDSVQLGTSKVFLRKNAHDILESRRSRRLSSAARKIQSIYRSFGLRLRFLRSKIAALIVQRNYRGFIGRKQAWAIKKNNSAITIQTAFRSQLAYNRYMDFKWAVLRMQSMLRGGRDRKLVADLIVTRNTIKLQRIARGMMALRKFRKIRSAVVSLQCRARQNRAKKELRDLKVAAKDLGTLKQSNEALKAEIEMLKSKAAEETKQKMLEYQQKMEHEALAAREVERSLRIENQTLVIELQREKEKSKSLSDELAAAHATINILKTQAAAAPVEPKPAAKASRRPSGYFNIAESPEYKEIYELYMKEKEEKERLQEQLKAGNQNRGGQILGNHAANRRRPSLHPNAEPMQAPAAPEPTSEIDSQPTVPEPTRTLKTKPLIGKPLIINKSAGIAVEPKPVKSEPAPVIARPTPVVSRPAPQPEPESVPEAPDVSSAPEQAPSAAAPTGRRKSTNSKLFQSFDNDNEDDEESGAQSDEDDVSAAQGIATEPAIESIASASETTPKKNSLQDIILQNANSISARARTSISIAMSQIASNSNSPATSSMTVNPLSSGPSAVRKRVVDDSRGKNSYEKFQTQMTGNGFICKYWDGSKSASDIILKSDAGKNITFKLRTLSFFSKDPNPVNVSNVNKCIPGSDFDGPYDQSCFLTLFCTIGAEQRIIALLFETNGERDLVLDGVNGMKSNAEPERAMVDLSAPSSPLPHVSDSQGGSDEFKALYYQEQMAHQKLKAEKSQLLSDIQERNEQIATLKRKEIDLQHELKTRVEELDRERESTLQFGKKFQDLFLDKQELMEEIENLNEQIAELQSELDELKSK